MRVICIAQPATILPGLKSRIKVSGRYEVNRENEYQYELAIHLGCGYDKSLFIPLSDIDETQLINKEYATEQSTDTCTAQLHDTSGE